MGGVNSKPAPCPFEQLLQDRRERAKSMGYTRGKASSFYFLCANGKIDEVRQTLDAEDAPSIDELNKLQPNGSTPLHAATYYNHLEVVKLLLERDCPRNTLNRFGNTAYEEAETNEMRQLFDRDDALNRFHETNTANTVSLYLPESNIDGMNVDSTVPYIQIFKSQSDILEYTINQQTTAMWVKFYDWFFHTFRTFIEREDLHIDAFDLPNHPDFKQFLSRSLPESNVEKTMESVQEARRSNSIDPLITLYTSEKAGFYRPLNALLGQSSPNTNISPHLCDRFIIEFYIRRQELKQRSFTGITYRGATLPANDLVIYKRAAESNPPGVLGLKAFTSTSRDPLVALQFALRTRLEDGKRHVIFVYEIMEPSPTIFGVDDISIYKHEQEVLILPGNLFTVTKVKEQAYPPITRIYLKHWYTPISFWKKIKQTIRAGRVSVLAGNEQNENTRL
jgi:hypothetical protein